MGASANVNRSTSRSGPTLSTNERASEIWRAAQGAAGAVPSTVTGAQDYYTGAQGAGRQGLDALTGNAAAQQQFMNPYQQQVIDKMNEQFEVQNQMTTQGINDQATQAGAFGGSRHGVAQGVALGENARNQRMQVAGLLNQGFEGSMNRAAQTAGLGFDAAGAGANLGLTAGSPELWRLNTLNRGFHPFQTSRSSGWGAGGSVGVRGGGGSSSGGGGMF